MKQLLPLLFLFPTCLFSQTDLTSFVDPFIGTSNYGATHPGAVVPWGMASVVPFNVSGKQNKYEKDSQWLSNPYWKDNNFLTGFSHINLSGVGCPDLGVLLLMPTTGEREVNPRMYGSSYRDEEAHPGYFSTYLEKHKVRTELTATTRTGLSRYTFPAGQSHILLNLGLGLTNESGASVRIVSDAEIEGSKLIGTFCYNPGTERQVFFVARFSKPAKTYGVWKKQPKLQGVEDQWSNHSGKYKFYEGFNQTLAGDSIGVYFSYETRDQEEIMVKMGVSYVSIENARENLDKEQAGFDFEAVRKNAVNAWNEQLSRIQVEGGTKEDKVKFYTALYHTLLHPNIFQDVNGEYPEMGNFKTGKITTGNRYTVFSLWDTYRNVHSFLSLVYPERQEEMVNTLLDMYKESGWLPKWELLGRETNVMVGDPAIPVIVDSYLRGIRGFDVDLAYTAMKKSATTLEGNKLRPGIRDYIEKGYIPIDGKDKVWGSLSTTLEYNVADWNLAQMAKVLGKTDDYDLFYQRSLSYKKFYEPSFSILRPLMADGSFIADFDPEFGKNFEAVPGYVEGTAWQYTFFTPHDIPGRIALAGGEKPFVAQLQKTFDDSLFSMINEPDITYPYLFNYVKGEEWRTQKAVRNSIDTYFTTQAGGIPGNDDTGTLSAWLLFSMMGFYPDCPGNMNYSLSSPVFERVKIALDPAFFPGKELVIETKGSGKYIQKITWNGSRQKGYFFPHGELVKGGKMVFELKE
ncbi:MAG: GH92 family glycosyl hydrolase [Bacteroidia bacterium]